MKKVLFTVSFVACAAITVACQQITSPSESESNQSSTSESPAIVSDQAMTNQETDHQEGTHQETANFNEDLYLFANPDVKDLIKQGKYKSGLDHYTQVGQTSEKPDGGHYETFFTGTPENDTVQGFGKEGHAHFVGVKLELVEGTDQPFPLKFQSLGKGEMDVLIGLKEGGNEFLLGSLITSVNPKAEPFYVGNGEKDYARVQNFIKSKDALILAGKPDQYKFESKEGNMQILTKDGDLVAIVEGVDKLEMGEYDQDSGIFEAK